jgi:hypothetical protein
MKLKILLILLLFLSFMNGCSKVYYFEAKKDNERYKIIAETLLKNSNDLCKQFEKIGYDVDLSSIKRIE